MGFGDCDHVEHFNEGLEIMRGFHRTILRAALVAVGIAVAGVSSSAGAAEVTLSGYSNGAFNSATPPNTSSTQTATLLGLSYVNSTFSGTTVGGVLGLGSAPVAPATQNTQNLGAFQLNTSVASYTGNTFALRATFTAPTVIAGGNTSTFSATLTGSVSGVNGGVFIDFVNTPQLFTFANGPTVGSFTFSVNDVAINPGGLVPLTGQVLGAQQQVPEPASAALFAIGAGAVAMRRRRAR